MMLAGLRQILLSRHLRGARALGLPEAHIWLTLIAPQLWPLIRLPVLVVLAYSMLVVDVAMILGPANPPTLVVMLTRLYGDPDLTRLLPAAAGSVLQLGLVVVAGLGVAALQRAMRTWEPDWVARGHRVLGLAAITRIAGFCGAVMLVLTLASLAVWSVTWRWSFPDILPARLSWRFWGRAGQIAAGPLATTLVLALASTAAALTAAIAWLDAEDRCAAPRAPWAEALIYLPLLLPKIAFH